MTDWVKIVAAGDIAGGESWSVSMAFVTDGFASGIGPTEIQAAAQNADANVRTTWWNPSGSGTFLQSNATALSYHLCRVYAYSDYTLRWTGASLLGQVGASSSAGQPLYTARVVTLRTALAGRSFRGRMYFPFTGVAPATATGLWSSGSALLGFFNSWVTLQSAFLEGAICDDAKPAVVSKVSGGADRPVPVLTPVTTLTMDNKPDTQRGRERGIAASITDSVAIV